MTESFKGIPAMIIACAAKSSSSKRQVVVGKVPACIIHATSSKSYAIQPIIFFILTTREDIKSKGIFIPINYCKSFFFSFKSNYREYGPENFILHHGTIYGYILQYSRLDK